MTRRINTFGKRGGGGRRATERVSAGLPAQLVSLAHRHPAILIEISTTGARVRAADPPRKNSEVLLVVEHISSYSRIIWRSGEVCGLRFVDEIDLFDVELIRHKASGASTERMTPQQKGGVDDWRSGLAR